MTPEERQALERRIGKLLGYTMTPLNWTTSETANARLLEMMKHSLMYSAWPSCEGWRVDLGVTEHGGKLIGPTHLDRKIAVCLAFVPWFTSLSAEERAEVSK